MWLQESSLALLGEEASPLALVCLQNQLVVVVVAVVELHPFPLAVEVVPQGEEEGRPEVVGHLGVVGEEVLLLPEVGVEVGAGLHHPDRWTQVVGHLGASWRWLAASPSSTHFCSKHSQGHQPWSPPC